MKFTNTLPHFTIYPPNIFLCTFSKPKKIYTYHLIIWFSWANMSIFPCPYYPSMAWFKGCIVLIIWTILKLNWFLFMGHPNCLQFFATINNAVTFLQINLCTFMIISLKQMYRNEPVSNKCIFFLYISVINIKKYTNMSKLFMAWLLSMTALKKLSQPLLKCCPKFP